MRVMLRLSSIKKKTLVLWSTFFAVVLFGYWVSNVSISAKPANASNESGVTVPIIMYHSVCLNTQKNNEFVVSTDQFLKDMSYFKDNGYTTVFVSDLIDYVYSHKPLPSKPIVITFDDGYLNNFINVIPILEQLDMKAVVSVIGVYTDKFSTEYDKNLQYSHMTWDDIKSLNESGRIEIGNHTYNMHESGPRKGCMKKPNESEAQYQKALTSDLTKLQNAISDKIGLTPAVFTYPYGFVSPESVPIIKELGFKAALTCDEKVNILTGDTEELYNLGRYCRTPGTSMERFMKDVVK